MYISIDIGKSSTRVASTQNLVDIHKIIKFSTDQNLEEQKKLLADAIYNVRDNQDIKLIVLGVTGVVDKVNKKFIKSPNFPALDGLNFNFLLPEVLRHIPIYVENDAALGALGEAYFGSGKSKSLVAYLTLSSGVGGALILKGKKGYNIISSEPGHHIICELDNLVDKSGLSGTFESYCSGSMFETRYGVKPQRDINQEIWKTYARHLSTGIINITALWRPEVIILGGGLSNYNFDIFYPYLSEELKKQSFFVIPEIKKALLEDNSGVYGGFVLLDILSEKNL